MAPIRFPHSVPFPLFATAPFKRPLGAVSHALLACSLLAGCMREPAEPLAAPASPQAPATPIAPVVPAPLPPEVAVDSLSFPLSDASAARFAGHVLHGAPGECAELPKSPLLPPAPAAKTACGCTLESWLVPCAGTERFEVLDQGFDAVDSVPEGAAFNRQALSIAYSWCVCDLNGTESSVIKGKTILVRGPSGTAKMSIKGFWDGEGADRKWSYKVRYAYDRNGSGRFPTSPPGGP